MTTPAAEAETTPEFDLTTLRARVSLAQTQADACVRAWKESSEHPFNDTYRVLKAKAMFAVGHYYGLSEALELSHRDQDEADEVFLARCRDMSRWSID